MHEIQISIRVGGRGLRSICSALLAALFSGRCKVVLSTTGRVVTGAKMGIRRCFGAKCGSADGPKRAALMWRAVGRRTGTKAAVRVWREHGR